MDSKEETIKSEQVEKPVVEPKQEQKAEPKKCNKPNCSKNNKELEKLVNDNKVLNEKLLRVTAEMQNMKRRYDEEISRIYKYDGEDLAKKILPILDNFERAIDLDSSNMNESLSKFLSGFKMIYTNLIEILNNKGISEIDALNKEFDPSCMDAILTEKQEGVESNKVINVLQKGYIYNDKVIRPAMVKVSE